MPHTLFEDLAIWCLLDAGCTSIVIVDDKVVNGTRSLCHGIHGIGIEGEDDPMECQLWLESLCRLGFEPRVINLKNHPGQGTRCTHAMSGRTA